MANLFHDTYDISWLHIFHFYSYLIWLQTLCTGRMERNKVRCAENYKKLFSNKLKGWNGVDHWHTQKFDIIWPDNGQIVTTKRLQRWPVLHKAWLGLTNVDSNWPLEFWALALLQSPASYLRVVQPAVF